MAEALAEAGADIIGTSQTLEEAGSEAERRIRGLGRAFHAITADLGERAQVIELARAIERLGPVDILVNNAGTILRAPAAEHADEIWDAVIEVDLTSQFILAREIGRGMVDRGRGKIIFTASVLSFQGGINVPGYAAAKSGLVGLMRALSNEWVGRGVCVNAIAPGYIATDNTHALRNDPVRSEAILGRIPAGRWGAASDLAGATVFLASSASDYVSGVVLPVDGGWLAR
jgi:2-deoxy-D-gluconate 3-dehydrogenase